MKHHQVSPATRMRDVDCWCPNPACKSLKDNYDADADTDTDAMPSECDDDLTPDLTWWSYFWLISTQQQQQQQQQQQLTAAHWHRGRRSFFLRWVFSCSVGANQHPERDLPLFFVPSQRAEQWRNCTKGSLLPLRMLIRISRSQQNALFVLLIRFPFRADAKPETSILLLTVGCWRGTEMPAGRRWAAQVLRRRSRGGECGQVLDGMFNIGNSWCKTGRI